MNEPRIEDHAVIGDGRTAALITRSGTLDWLCWPRFDSPPLFGSLLDPGAGFWSLRPAGAFRSSRAYLDDTNVLRTTFETASGAFTATDFLPALTERERAGRLSPSHVLHRLVECVSGEVDLATEIAPAPDFGRRRARARATGLGVRFDLPRGVATLRSDLPLEVHGAGARARARLRAGDKRVLTLSLALDWPDAFLPLAEAWRDLELTTAWWRDWCSALRYTGPERGSVIRSALALRLMLYAPSGALVAAPTTSLPEKPGGDYNWDYRFCWLRDASLTARALLGLGCVEEAEAFAGWLLHSTRLTRPALRVLYDVFGNKPRRERRVPVRGYRNARPVRVGNAAMDQLQLDVYGEVVQAASEVIVHAGRADRETQRMLAQVGDYVCRRWQEPDEGIWEPRSGRAHRTHSKALCWAALDRLIMLRKKGLLRRGSLERWSRAREAVRSHVVSRGWDPEAGAYTAILSRPGTYDASVLLLGWHGLEAPSSPRMRATCKVLRRELAAGGGWLYRSDDPELRGEGAFGACGFWAADVLARGAGDLEEAEELFGRLCSQSNDVGLFAEEIEPRSGRALGNFPQAFTHVGLINAALSLEQRRREEALK